MPAEAAERPLRILQVSTLDRGGGAEQVAWNLHQAYRARGHDAWLAVGRKRSSDPTVLPLAAPSLPRRGSWAWGCQGLSNHLQPWQGRLPGIGRARQFLRDLADGWEGLARRYGVEDFHHPASRALLSLPPHRPDLVHAHNLHGGYFDLRYLARLSRQVPVVLTLHDAWLLSGHCAHSLGCERWRTGCGRCPDLGIYPAVPRDATAWNWRRKRAIFARSRLYVATPCQWLLDRVAQSILAPAMIEGRVIPNGVPTDVFYPGDRRAARVALGLPLDQPILLMAANGLKHNVFKDYQTLHAALSQLADTATTPLRVVALGETATDEHLGQMHIQFVPHTLDQQRVADYYRAADLYLHAARAETFPNTILEAMACGTPVIATAVGGIAEQVKAGVTGLLVAPGDARAMADGIRLLLDDPVKRDRFSRAGVKIVIEQFDLTGQVGRYLGWYREMMEGVDAAN